MKHIFIFLFSFLSVSLFAQEISIKDSINSLPATLTAVQNGEFLDTKTFGGALPKPGDNIIIPRQIIVTISNDINFNNNGDDASTIYNSGVLLFGPKGTLALANGSVVYGNESSILDRDGRENASIIKIGKMTFYGGSDTTVQGPVIFPSNVNPGSFLNVTVSNKNHSNVINWSTIRECHARSFQILRSENGSDWQVITTVSAIGNSKTLHTYLFSDSNVSSSNLYYRIKIIDEMGRGQYSYIRSAKNVETKDNLSAR